MPTGLLPQAVEENTAFPTHPQAVVETFLASLADSDLERSAALVDDEIDYLNVGLTLWRDSFDFLDVLRGTARGLVGAVAEGLQPSAPSGLDEAPDR